MTKDSLTPINLKAALKEKEKAANTLLFLTLAYSLSSFMSSVYTRIIRTVTPQTLALE